MPRTFYSGTRSTRRGGPELPPAGDARRGIMTTGEVGVPHHPTRVPCPFPDERMMPRISACGLSRGYGIQYSA